MTHRSKIKLLHGWRTQWCRDVPMEDGEAVFDAAVYVNNFWPTFDQAEAHAHKVLKEQNPFWGCVTIDEFQWVQDSHFTSLYEFELVGNETVEVTR